MDTGIRPAEERDLPALTEIWKVCFHDPEEYIRFFYRENFPYLSAAVYTEDDRPVSMLHMLEASFADGPRRLDARFLYAGGTLPAFRGRGYYGALFRYVTALADREGFALFGKPASRELLPYYQALGFRQDACLRLVTIRPAERLPLSFSPLTPHEYNRLRDLAFAGRPYAKWTDRHVGWCFADNEWFGGQALSFRLDGAVHFLLGGPEDGALALTETDLTLAQLRRAAGAICSLFGAPLLKAYLPDFACREGEEIVSSIVYHAPLRNTYVNLTLS
ncbi:MAG: GNAT family N-acetyltransferase [Clostridia bacterium]|nr:GNAT family N-acetyltransferase [Clostridia bacterium]